MRERRIAEYDRFATAHPQNPSAVLAMRRSATLARQSAEDVLGEITAALQGDSLG